ncbi:anthranilate synthase component II [Microbacterium indicum]|uniref:anthranilate synthase component II n=1 Tax=Microbacterium indicum TaxID=358100 RepID=UPI00042A3878|nr:aminodeoxychorismate/anthranilate synthase component II [Microbacterium indicum]
MPRVLLVDHDDSYTGSLAQIIWAHTGEEPDLVQSGDVRSIAGFDRIVIGPGPGSPHSAADVGRDLEILRAARVPVLGVCFGFQAMAVAAGGSVVRTRPAHGRVERVTHDGSPLFDGVPRTFDAVRYHSLVVAEPAPFAVTARAADGLPMAGEDPGRGWFGVQFHPESIGSPDGARIVTNFLDRA